jgi:hypothetical protein
MCQEPLDLIRSLRINGSFDVMGLLKWARMWTSPCVTDGTNVSRIEYRVSMRGGSVSGEAARPVERQASAHNNRSSPAVGLGPSQRGK